MRKRSIIVVGESRRRRNDEGGIMDMNHGARIMVEAPCRNHKGSVEEETWRTIHGR